MLGVFNWEDSGRIIMFENLFLKVVFDMLIVDVLNFSCFLGKI